MLRTLRERSLKVLKIGVYPIIGVAVSAGVNALINHELRGQYGLGYEFNDIRTYIPPGLAGMFIDLLIMSVSILPAVDYLAKLNCEGFEPLIRKYGKDNSII